MHTWGNTTAIHLAWLLPHHVRSHARIPAAAIFNSFSRQKMIEECYSVSTDLFQSYTFIFCYEHEINEHDWQNRLVAQENKQYFFILGYRRDAGMKIIMNMETWWCWTVVLKSLLKFDIKCSFCEKVAEFHKLWICCSFMLQSSVKERIKFIYSWKSNSSWIKLMAPVDSFDLKHKC